MADVGVVVPARDAAATLGRALRSVARQDPPPAALVVVDDHSRDGTVEVATHHGARVVPSPGRGAGIARNTGVATLDTEWVAFLDADDAWPADYLARLRRRMRAATPQLICAGRIEISESGRFVRVARPPTRDVDAVDLLGSVPVITSGVTVRHRDLDAVGGFDEELRFSQDMDLWFRLVRAGVEVRALDAFVRYTVRDRDETLAKLRTVEGNEAVLAAKLGTYGLDGGQRARIARLRRLQLGRRYEASGFDEEARRCLRDCLPEPVAMVFYAATFLPRVVRQRLRRAVRRRRWFAADGRVREAYRELSQV